MKHRSKSPWTLYLLPSGLALALLATAALASDEVTIKRSFSKIKLGMDLADVQDQFPTKEVPNHSQISGERRLEVQAHFSGIERVLGTFYLDKLFRIEIFYSPDYSDQVPWETLVEYVKKDYGEGWLFESTQGPAVIWNDGSTSFMLEKKPALQSPAWVYVASLVDEELFNARQESCPLRKRKA